MASKFQPIIRRARFAVPGYSAQQMLAVGTGWTEQAIIPRIQRGLDVYDNPAPALRPGYAKLKALRHPPAIRNWTFTGRTLRSLKVLSVGPNKCVIGFTDPESNKRAAINNRKARQFGGSPQDEVVLLNLFVRLDSPVKVVAA